MLINCFLKQFSKYKHILIVTDVDPETFTCSNDDCIRGGYRHIDISKAPFNVQGKKLMIYPTENYRVFKQVLYIENN